MTGFASIRVCLCVVLSQYMEYMLFDVGKSPRGMATKTEKNLTIHRAIAATPKSMQLLYRQPTQSVQAERKSSYEAVGGWKQSSRFVLLRTAACTYSRAILHCHS